MLLLVAISDGSHHQRVVATFSFLAIAFLLILQVISLEAASTPVDVASKSITSDDVERICSDKKVKIGSIAQMNQVINAARIVEGLCKKKYMASLNELEAILRVPREDLCNDRSFELIRSYHFRFISPVRHTNRRATQFEPDPHEVVRAQLHPEPRKYSLEFDEYNQPLMIPIAVRHFWLAFALQLSAQCKRNLLDNLKTDTAKYLGEEDHAVMDVFNKESPIGKILAEGMTLINFDNALYMPELEGEIKGNNRPSQQRVYVKTETTKGSSLYTLVSACQTRFRPIYQKLLMPVIRLVKLGYDYQGDQLTAEERHELVGQEVKTWLGLVNVCETFERVIVLKPTDSQLAALKDKSDRKLEVNDQVFSVEQSESEDDEISESLDSGDNSADNDTNKLETITSQEADQLTNGEASGELAGGVGEGLSLIEGDNAIQYSVTKLNRMEDGLWITSERQLDLELSKKAGNTNPFGFKGFMRRAGRKIKRAFAKLDPDKFAHYRHNSLWYAGIFNLISGITNSLSTGITAVMVLIVLI